MIRPVDNAAELLSRGRGWALEHTKRFTIPESETYRLYHRDPHGGPKEPGELFVDAQTLEHLKEAANEVESYGRGLYAGYITTYFFIYY